MFIPTLNMVMMTASSCFISDCNLFKGVQRRAAKMSMYLKPKNAIKFKLSSTNKSKVKWFSLEKSWALLASLLLFPPFLLLLRGEVIQKNNGQQTSSTRVPNNFYTIFLVSIKIIVYNFSWCLQMQFFWRLVMTEIDHSGNFSSSTRYPCEFYMSLKPIALKLP